MRSFIRSVFFVALLFCCIGGLLAQTVKEPVLVTDMLKIKSAGAITLSNDGKKMAFTVTAIEPETDNKWEYKYVNQIWVGGTEPNAMPKQLTGKE
ncbi:MAG TPA: hypothetical protein VL307_07940, partial [Chitinophagaceae bacterium]|nr:hypothetical protein [Chitinophagaceae bacterium]